MLFAVLALLALIALGWVIERLSSWRRRVARSRAYARRWDAFPAGVDRRDVEAEIGVFLEQRAARWRAELDEAVA